MYLYKFLFLNKYSQLPSKEKKQYSYWKWTGQVNLLANTFLQTHAVLDELLISALNSLWGACLFHF